MHCTFPPSIGHAHPGALFRTTLHPFFYPAIREGQPTARPSSQLRTTATSGGHPEVDAERQSKGRLRVESVDPASGLSGLVRSYGGRCRFPSLEGPRGRFCKSTAGSDRVGSSAGTPRREKGTDSIPSQPNQAMLLWVMYLMEMNRTTAADTAAAIHQSLRLIVGGNNLLLAV